MRHGMMAGLLTAALGLAGCDTSRISTTSQADPAHSRVWRLSAEGVVVNDVPTSETTTVPLPGWTWADAPWSCMPGMALGPRGEAVVTSNVVPIVWRIDPDTLAVSEHPLTLDADGDKDLGFTGLIYSRDHDAYFAVSGPHGTLWKIDSALTHGKKVALSMAMHGACRVAITPRMMSEASARRAVRLCASGDDRSWTVDVVLALADDQRRAEDAARRPVVAIPQLAMSCGDY